MQTRRRGTRGTSTDAEFRLADGRLLIVEIDGIGHLDVRTWHEDITRQNELARTTGAMILRVPGFTVRHDPDPFFEILMSLPIVAGAALLKSIHLFGHGIPGGEDSHWPGPVLPDRESAADRI